jgi:bleomycin hydrolase
MPDTFHSKNSSNMNKHLTMKLKDDFYKLSKVPLEETEILINEMVIDVYKLLVGFLGKPPTTFNWTFKTKKEVVTWVDLSPLSFLNKTGFNPDDWVSVINDPRQENPYYNKYMIKYLGNTSDLHVNWINLPINRLKELSKLSIDNNQPVWFGCDVGAECDKDTGIHDIKLYDYESFMNYNISMSKEEKLRYFASIPSHAMVILGYHENNSLIERWKIENSWGSSSGTSGFQLMSDKWFSEYVFQIVINKNLLKEDELNILQSNNYTIIEPWDPLGTLA